MKELKKQMVLDKEQLLITNQKLEKSLAQQVEELSKLTSDFTALKKVMFLRFFLLVHFTGN